MTSNESTFSDYLAVLRHRWRPASAAFIVIFVAFVVMAYTIPAVYVSSATLQIEPSEISSDIVGSTTTTYVEERLQAVSQRVMATNNITAIIEKLNLYGDSRKTEAIEELVADFRLNTLLTPVLTASVDPRSMRSADVTYAFTLSFQYSDAILAQSVVTELSALYLKENESLRSESAVRATDFLKTETSRIQQELAKTQERMVELKSKFAVGLTENDAANIQRLDFAERELGQIDDNLRAARERRALLETELAQTPRHRPVLDESGQPIVGSEDRLAQAQQELVRLLAKYSEDHPDVARLRREIASLSTGPVDRIALNEKLRNELALRQSELETARKTYSPNHPDVVNLQRTVELLQQQINEAGQQSALGPVVAEATNPVYQQVSTRLQTAEQEIADLSRRRSDLVIRIQQYNQGPFQSRQAENEYTNLLRDYELLQTQYRDLRQKQSAVELSEKLESTREGGRYTIVDRASLPVTPIKPDRAMLAFLGLVLALAGGLGTAALTESMDPTVRGQRDILLLLDTAPLAIVPYVRNSEDHRRQRRTKLTVAAGAAAVIVVVVLISVLSA